MKTLDLATLRTLVVANDLGGYGLAGSRLGLTPSAVSLQMKRLQDDVGTPLFRKSGRGVALNETGEIVLRYARRLLAQHDELLDTIHGAALTGSVRLGCAQDFAESVLPAVLGRFAELYPLVLVEVRIEGNRALAESCERGELDLALTVGEPQWKGAETVGEIELNWIAERHFTPREEQPLPLVLLGPQCVFRRTTIAALDEVKRAWRVAAVSPSLAGLWASIRGGLGITVRSAAGVPSGLVAQSDLFGLPELGTLPVVLHTAAGGGVALERLRDLVLQSVRQPAQV